MSVKRCEGIDTSEAIDSIRQHDTSYALLHVEKKADS